MAEMIVCDRCGSAAPLGASVCPNCGAPLGGVDASAAGVPVETVRTDPISSANDLPSLGTQMPVGGGKPPEAASNPWQESLPPAASAPPPEQQVFNAPPAAAAPARRFPWQWIVGCCLAIVLLACLLAIAIGVIVNNISY